MPLRATRLFLQAGDASDVQEMMQSAYGGTVLLSMIETPISGGGIVTDVDVHAGDSGGGLSRRDMLRRSAVVGGTLLWAAPAVQSFAGPAMAAGGTPRCTVRITVEFDPPGSTICLLIVADFSACCDCLTDAAALSDPAEKFRAVLTCLSSPACTDAVNISLC
jgi:hypothetical protein